MLTPTIFTGSSSTACRSGIATGSKPTLWRSRPDPRRLEVANEPLGALVDPDVEAGPQQGSPPPSAPRRARSSVAASTVVRSGFTYIPPLKAATAVLRSSAFTILAMPRGGRPLVTVNLIPAAFSLSTASRVRVVSTLSLSTNVPSMSAMKARMFTPCKLRPTRGSPVCGAAAKGGTGPLCIQRRCIGRLSFDHAKDSSGDDHDDDQPAGGHRASPGGRG